MKTTLKLSFTELRALGFWLMAILEHSNELVRQNVFYAMQMDIMGELLLKRIHPKTLVDTGKPISMKLNRYESMALQAAIYNGWGRYCTDMYVQNTIRHLSMNKLPKLVDYQPGYLLGPDEGWEK